MRSMFEFFILVAGLIHIYIFLMESVFWGTPKINKAFGVTPEQAEQNRLFAFNQGFYNLFLAVAALLGIVLNVLDYKLVGQTLMAYAALSMLGAALVLLASNSKLFRPALIQGGPPLMALIFLFLS